MGVDVAATIVAPDLLAQARTDIGAAKARYLDCMARFGTDMWVTEAPIREFAIEEDT